MNGWRDNRYVRDRWIDGWMDGWMDGESYGCVEG